MHKIRKYLFCVYFLIILLSGCSNVHNKSFILLNNAFLDWYFKYNPLESLKHNNIFKPENYKLNKSSLNEYSNDIERFLIELDQIDYTKLSENNKINYDMIIKKIKNLDFSYNVIQFYQFDTSYYLEKIFDMSFSIIYNSKLEMNVKVQFIIELLSRNILIINHAYENISYFDKNLREHSNRIYHDIVALFDQIPLEINTSNKNYEIIENLIIENKKKLEAYYIWMNSELENMSKVSMENDDIGEKGFELVVGDGYSYENINIISKKKSNKIFDKIFSLALPMYLNSNDEPIWVDKNDSIQVIKNVFDEIYSEKIYIDDILSSYYQSYQASLNRFSASSSIPIKDYRMEFDFSNYTSIEEDGFIENSNYYLYDDIIPKYLINYQMFREIQENNLKSLYINKYYLNLNAALNFYPGNILYFKLLTNNDDILRKLFFDEIALNGVRKISYNIYKNKNVQSANDRIYNLLILQQELINSILTELEYKYFNNILDKEVAISKIKNNCFLSLFDAKMIWRKMSGNYFYYTKRFISDIEMNVILNNGFNNKSILDFIYNNGLIPLRYMK